jgi:adenylate kinase family enzyme
LNGEFVAVILASSMRRVLIFGPPASGKSTLARRLGALLDLPVHDLDLLYWQPGWTRTPDERWRRVVESLAERDSWILDGEGDAITIDVCLMRCDTIIYVELRPALRLRRLVMRWITRSRERNNELPLGCREPLSWRTVEWALRGYGRITAPRVRAALASEGDRRAIELRSSQEIAIFVDSIERGASTQATAKNATPKR